MYVHTCQCRVCDAGQLLLPLETPCTLLELILCCPAGTLASLRQSWVSYAAVTGPIAPPEELLCCGLHGQTLCLLYA